MRPDVDGDPTIGKVSHACQEVRSPLSSCPRSSLPADVLAWLAARLAHLTPSRPPDQGGTPPLLLEVRLDAVAAVLLDGLSYRRAARMVGISKTEVGESLDLLLGELAAVGSCQPDGSFVTTLDDLRALLVEMAHAGEAVVVDGLRSRNRVREAAPRVLSRRTSPPTVRTACSSRSASVGKSMSASTMVVSTRSLRARSSLSVASLPSSAVLSCSAAAVPQRRTSLLRVVGCGTGWSSGMRQNRRQAIESPTSRQRVS